VGGRELQGEDEKKGKGWAGRRDRVGIWGGVEARESAVHCRNFFVRKKKGGEKGERGRKRARKYCGEGRRRGILEQAELKA